MLIKNVSSVFSTVFISLSFLAIHNCMIVDRSLATEFSLDEFAKIRNNEFGFVASYPKGWVKLNNDIETVRLFVGKSDHSISYQIIAHKIKKEYSMSPENYVSFLINNKNIFRESINAIIPNASLISLEETNMSNRPALAGIFTGTLKSYKVDVPVTILLITSCNDNVLYELVFIAHSEVYQNAYPMFIVLTSSFMMIPQSYPSIWYVLFCALVIILSIPVMSKKSLIVLLEDWKFFWLLIIIEVFSFSMIYYITDFGGYFLENKTIDIIVRIIPKLIGQTLLIVAVAGILSLIINKVKKYQAKNLKRLVFLISLLLVSSCNTCDKLVVEKLEKEMQVSSRNVNMP